MELMKFNRKKIFNKFEENAKIKKNNINLFKKKIVFFFFFFFGYKYLRVIVFVIKYIII